jgi:hypothetical protein
VFSIRCAACRRERRNEQMNGYYRNDPERFKARARAARLAHPAKTKARNAVRTAKKQGRLRPKPCIKCGSKRNVQAHHPDYSRALEVEWLCASCHGLDHHRST